LDNAMQLLKEQLKKNKQARPSLFAIVQTLGSECHRRLLGHQEDAAQDVRSDPVWGPRLQDLRHKEVKEHMQQQLPGARMADILAAAPRLGGHVARVDEQVLPALMCSVASAMLGKFKEALLRSVPSAQVKKTSGGDAAAEENFRGRRNSIAKRAKPELKVGPIKGKARIGVKVKEYEDEKGQGNYPYSQFVTDILRASFLSVRQLKIS